MPTYPDQVRAAERREARNRKAWKRPIGIAALRVAELDREFTDRYGSMVLPEDDSARDDIEIMLHHLARRSPDPQRIIPQWLDARVPWFMDEERGAMVAKVLANPLKFRADTLASRIGLTAERRARLKIRTIGAIDQSAAERKEARRRAGIERKRAKRRAAGIPQRPEQSGQTIAALAPWEAAGISRRTWFRRRARHGVTATVAI